MRYWLLIFTGALTLFTACISSKKACCVQKDASTNMATSSPEKVVKNDSVIVEPVIKTLGLGAEQTGEYLPLLKGKKIALVVNQTSTIQQTHLVDSLVSLNIDIKHIFAPEHGFRGKADAGEHVKNGIDQKTNLPIISLYGKNKKPSPEQLQGVDMVVFDIQDVGVRFYTYISTMHYVMEACAEQNIPVLILDRPNPNGHYVAGPVLDLEFQSFVGMHPIPIVHGLTVGELAMMINGEQWLKNGVKCDVKVIKCQNYTHQTKYILPIKPSPNLPNDLSIQLYPSLCLFEPTKVSVGRGTQTPFQIIGCPQKNMGTFTFTPKSIIGMSKYPKHENKMCYGINFSDSTNLEKFSVQHLVEFYQKYDNKEAFFTSENFFSKLSGNKLLIRQIKEGKSYKEIEASWEEELKRYKLLRAKYLLYFE